jgi:hypothetical protein
MLEIPGTVPARSLQRFERWAHLPPVEEPPPQDDPPEREPPDNEPPEPPVEDPPIGAPIHAFSRTGSEHMEQRLVLWIFVVATMAIAASMLSSIGHAAETVRIGLIETFRGSNDDSRARYLLLRATADNGDRFAETFAVGDNAPSTISFVVGRDCTLEQFEVLNAEMRWIVRGDVSDGSGQVPHAEEGQTVVVWYAPTAAAVAR